MTTSKPSRLDQIERILERVLETVAEQQQLFQSQIQETRQLVAATADITNSYARAIAAHSEELQTSLADHWEERKIPNNQSKFRYGSNQFLALVDLGMNFF